MANASFTRDEAILALDVLYSTNELRLSKDSKEIVELSELLNELPIIPSAAHNETFRSCSGISQQINAFHHSFLKGIKNPDVGAMFYAIADEFADKKDELHKTACAIRKNRGFFQTATFGSELEREACPEGALLYHLHRVVEARDSRKLAPADRCEICCLNLSEVYKPVSGGFLQFHLLVPITELDGSKRYKAEDFITVCPNCHAVLHRHRPWVTRDRVGEILF